MTEYQKEIQQTLAEVVPETDTQHRVSRIKFSTGVEFKVLPVNIFIIQEVINKFEYPPVPVEYNERLDRTIENPNSKSYVEQRAAVDMKRGQALIDTMSVLSLKPIHVPEGVPPLESDEWIDDLEFLNIEINRDNKNARKQAWVKFVAMSTPEDFTQFSNLVGRMMGVGDQEIAEKMSIFQGDEE